MKVLVLGRPLRLSLYKNYPRFSHKRLIRLPPVSCSSDNPEISTNTMSACIQTSRTESPKVSRDPNRSQFDENDFRYVKVYQPGYSDRVSRIPINRNHTKSIHTRLLVDDDLDLAEEREDVWLKMQKEARSDIRHEPIMSNYYFSSILSQKSIKSALANHLAIKLSNSSLPITTLFDLFMGVLENGDEIVKSVEEDLIAVKERDPACISYIHCFLSFKGFLACQAHRIAHKLWSQNRKVLALMIQNRVSESFAVDIHPGAKIGSGILFDHATGLVVGETAVIGNNVSILHNVTLGGTGKTSGDRHPKIGDGVLIGAGTCILGNITVGEGAKIGAGSVVLKDVPPQTTAVGNPARLIGGKANPAKLDKIPSLTMDHTSNIAEWSDYVI